MVMDNGEKKKKYNREMLPKETNPLASCCVTGEVIGSLMKSTGSTEELLAAN